MHPYLRMASRAAQRAGSSLIQTARNTRQLSLGKTQEDEWIQWIRRTGEHAMLETLEVYQDHVFLARETGIHQQQGGTNRWLIDALEGEKNYLADWPHYGVSAIYYQGDSPRHALIFDPLMDEEFFASRGQGARINDRRIRVSRRKSLQGALLGMTPHACAWGQETGADPPRLRVLEESGIEVRCSGSVALDLAYVAMGRLDLFWGTHLSPWDMAAGALLVREAGGFVSSPTGNDDYMESGTMVAGTPACCQELTAIIGGLYEPSKPDRKPG